MPSGSINNHQVRLLLAVVFETILRNVLGLLVAWLAVDWNLHPSRELFQLLQCARAISIRPNNTDPQASLLEKPCQFHRASSLSSALNANEHELAEQARLDFDLGRVLTHKLCHFLVEDFDNMFSPCNPWGKLPFQRAIFNGLGQLENEFDIHVSLQ